MPSDLFSRPRVVMLNIKAASVDAAAMAAQTYGDDVVIGVVARDFDTPKDAAAFVDQLHERGVHVSAGLGDGAADQWERALDVALLSHPVHLNQVFPAAALSQAKLNDAGAPTVVNALVQPSGTPGVVRVATGPRSQFDEGGDLSVEAALDMMSEMDVLSLKFHPLQGTSRLDELAEVAAATAERDMMLEPTGGITPENLEEVLAVCLGAGVNRVMPHLYSSVADETGELSGELLAEAMSARDRAMNRAWT
ncbi:MAG: KDGP aldolase [Actinomycetota bacterium]